MSKRKQSSRVERRREHVEVNLLAADEERGGLARARRGCTLPFVGGGVLILGFELLRIGLA